MQMTWCVQMITDARDRKDAEKMLAWIVTQDDYLSGRILEPTYFHGWQTQTFHLDCGEDNAKNLPDGMRRVLVPNRMLDKTPGVAIMGTEKQQRAKLYRACRKLADKLECTIDIDRFGSGSFLEVTYWVYGPRAVYRTDRSDPHDGSHDWCSWEEVWDALETYQRDLHFHAWGVSPEWTDTIILLADRPLLDAWIDNPDDRVRGFILADWLEEHGHEATATALREALNKK